MTDNKPKSKLTLSGNALVLAKQKVVDHIAENHGKGRAVAKSHGCGFSDGRASRSDRLLRGAEDFCATWNREGRSPVVLNVGGGDGSEAIQLVNLGAQVTVIDRTSLKPEAISFCQQGSIRPVTKSINEVRPVDLPPRIDVFLSLRTLHWVPFREAEKLLTMASQRMPEGARLYISLAGFDCQQFADGYPYTHETPLDQRFGHSKTVSSHFAHDVTLYMPSEATKMVENAGFDPQSVEHTPWGLITIQARRLPVRPRRMPRGQVAPKKKL